MTGPQIVVAIAVPTCTMVYMMTTEKTMSDYKGPRATTNSILEMVEEGWINRDYLIRACLLYMSEDQVADMAWRNKLFLNEEVTE